MTLTAINLPPHTSIAPGCSLRFLNYLQGLPLLGAILYNGWTKKLVMQSVPESVPRSLLRRLMENS
jgi:hypothetical protein